MAYADYLDRMPKAGMTAAEKFRTPLEGADGFYYDYVPETRSWVKTNVPVTHKKLEGSPPLAYQFFPGADGTWIKGNRVGGGMEEAKPPPGKTLPSSAEQTRKDVAQEAKLSESDAKELETLDSTLRGEFKDKNKNTIKPTVAHADRYNALSLNSEAVFVKQVPGMIYGTNEKVVRKPIANGIPARTAWKAFKFYQEEGGPGTFEQFITNPVVDKFPDGVMITAIEAMRRH
jgi:hypothetical protein